MQTSVLHFLISCLDTPLLDCLWHIFHRSFLKLRLHTNKRRSCSSTLSGHPSSSFYRARLECFQLGPGTLFTRKHGPKGNAGDRTRDPRSLAPRATNWAMGSWLPFPSRMQSTTRLPSKQQSLWKQCSADKQFFELRKIVFCTLTLWSSAQPSFAKKQLFRL